MNEMDSIDRLLRDDDTGVEDDGFVSRVVQSLPKPARRATQIPIFLFATAVVATALAVFWVPWQSLPAVKASDLLSPSGQVLQAWTLALTVFASLAWAVIAAVLQLA